MRLKRALKPTIFDRYPRSRYFGSMTSLDDPQVRQFLSEGTKVGKLGYLAKDGRPLVSPIWFLLKDDTLIFCTSPDEAKGKALQRDPRVVLTVDIETPPYSYIQIQGTAEADADPEHVKSAFREIANRYLPHEAAEAYVNKQGPEPRGVLFVIHPTKVVSLFDLL